MANFRGCLTVVMLAGCGAPPAVAPTDPGPAAEPAPASIAGSPAEPDAAAVDVEAPPAPPARPAGLVAELQLDPANPEQVVAVAACGADTIVALDGAGRLVRWTLDGRSQTLEVRPGVDDARWTARGQMQLSVLHVTGPRLFVARRDGYEEIHDLVELDCATGAVRAHHRPRAWIYAVGAPADGPPVVIAHDDRVIELGKRQVVRAVGRDLEALSPDGQRAVVATGGDTYERELLLWRSRRTLALDTGEYYSNTCAFSADGAQIVCAGPRGVAVHDGRSGARVARIPITSPRFDRLLVFPAARLVALVDYHEVALYRFDGARASFRLGDELVRGVAATTLDGDRPGLVTGDEAGVIRVWDLAALAPPPA